MVAVGRGAVCATSRGLAARGSCVGADVAGVGFAGGGAGWVVAGAVCGWSVVGAGASVVAAVVDAGVGGAAVGARDAEDGVAADCADCSRPAADGVGWAPAGSVAGAAVAAGEEGKTVGVMACVAVEVPARDAGRLAPDGGAEAGGRDSSAVEDKEGGGDVAGAGEVCADAGTCGAPTPGFAGTSPMLRIGEES
jgi:hypothetical protein